MRGGGGWHKLPKLQMMWRHYGGPMRSTAFHGTSEIICHKLSNYVKKPPLLLFPTRPARPPLCLAYITPNPTQQLEEFLDASRPSPLLPSPSQKFSLTLIQCQNPSLLHSPPHRGDDEWLRPGEIFGHIRFRSKCLPIQPVNLHVDIFQFFYTNLKYIL